MSLLGSAEGSLIVWDPKTADKIHVFGQPGKTHKGDSSVNEASTHFHKEPVTCISAHPVSPSALKRERVNVSSYLTDTATGS